MRAAADLATRGLMDAGRERVIEDVLAAWDDFLDVAGEADLGRASRLPGWRAHEVCVHLGAWDDYRALDGLVEGVRNGAEPGALDVDAANARVTAAHRDASREDVLAALRAHRDRVAAYADDDPGLDGAATASPVGPLPLLSVIAAEPYELAVHALDLHSAGAPEPANALLQLGIGALADVTGALAAAAELTATATLATPGGGWTLVAGADGWTVTRTAGDPPEGAAIRGDAATLLDASAGRANPVTLIARRRLSVQDVPGLLRLAPIVEHTPNVPGGPLLAAAARTLSGAGGILGRFLR